MGLFRKRAKRTSRRALRRAHTKTLKAQAKAEKKFQERAARRAAKNRRKNRSAPVTVAPVVRARPEAAADKKSADKKSERKPLTPKKVKNILGIVRVLSPVLAPLAYKAATATRGHLDAARARRIGVDVHQLGDFTGHGAALNARIAGIEPALNELLDNSSGDGVRAESTQFRDATRARLTELATAVHAAERMPTTRRKAAHRAISAELDAIDSQLLSRLGVR